MRRERIGARCPTCGRMIPEPRGEPEGADAVLMQEVTRPHHEGYAAALLSGSGSTVFAVLHDLREAPALIAAARAAGIEELRSVRDPSAFESMYAAVRGKGDDAMLAVLDAYARGGKWTATDAERPATMRLVELRIAAGEREAALALGGDLTMGLARGQQAYALVRVGAFELATCRQQARRGRRSRSSMR